MLYLKQIIESEDINLLTDHQEAFKYVLLGLWKTTIRTWRFFEPGANK